MTTSQVWGASFLGEVWFAASESPTGPWRYMRRIITHAACDGYQSMDFYNPFHHEYFDKHGGRFIFIEGTYTVMFVQVEKPTRYEYNQIIYMLDLADERLNFNTLTGESP